MLSTAFWMQDDHRATTEAVGNALDSQPRQRNYCPSLFPAQWPLGRILGTTRRWLISGRFFTYKFGAHPRQKGCLTFGPSSGNINFVNRSCSLGAIFIMGKYHRVTAPVPETPWTRFSQG